MGNHLSVATIIEKNRLHSNVAFLVGLEIDVIDPLTQDLVEVMRLVRNDEDLRYQGNNYIASNFDVEVRAAAGETPTINLTAIDYSRAIESKMQQFGGGVGFAVRVMVINTGNLDQPPEAVESYKVVKASSKDYVVTFTLGAENPLTLRFPRRLQFRDRCGWRYRSAQCGYAGGLPTCDYTLQGDNGCAAHGMTPNFGGFPGLMLRS